MPLPPSVAFRPSRVSREESTFGAMAGIRLASFSHPLSLLRKAGFRSYEPENAGA